MIRLQPRDFGTGGLSRRARDESERPRSMARRRMVAKTSAAGGAELPAFLQVSTRESCSTSSASHSRRVCWRANKRKRSAFSLSQFRQLSIGLPTGSESFCHRLKRIQLECLSVKCEKKFISRSDDRSKCDSHVGGRRLYCRHDVDRCRDHIRDLRSGIRDWGRRHQAVAYASVAIATVAFVLAFSGGEKRGKGFERISEPAGGGDAPDLSSRLRSQRMSATRGNLSISILQSMPREEAHNGYVGSKECRECHQREHRTWHASYHRRMTQKAGPDSIVGDFSAQVLTNAAYVNAGEIRRNGDEFLFRYLKEQGRERQGDDWKRISLTTGSHHMQAYWFPTGRGNTMDMMPFMHIRESGQWVPREAAFLMPPDEMFHPELGRWNEICMDCHTTGGQKRASLETRTHDSRAGELGISCEACHGPGENHAACGARIPKRISTETNSRIPL